MKFSFSFLYAITYNSNEIVKEYLDNWSCFVKEIFDN